MAVTPSTAQTGDGFAYLTGAAVRVTVRPACFADTADTGDSTQGKKTRFQSKRGSGSE